MHDSRQRRSVVRRINTKALVRSVLVLVAVVAIGSFLIPSADSEENPAGVVAAVVPAAH